MDGSIECFRSVATMQVLIREIGKGGGRSDAETGIAVKSEKKAESFETTNCR